MINILIADDNDSNIYVLEMLIDEWFDENNIKNYSIDSVLNGAESLKRLENTNYDVIFLDIMMPIMDGFEALKEIRSRNLNPKAKIIVASAVIDDEENKNKAKKLKANAFIVKPLSYDTINIMLTKYLNNKDISEDENVQNSTKYIYFDNHEKREFATLNSINFLSEYPSDMIDEEDIEELHHFISNFDHNVNSTADFDEHIDNFREIIEKSRIMLLSFSEFQNLNIALNELNTFTYNLHNEDILNKNLVSAQLLLITENLSTWFEEVFVQKNSEDVLSINKIILKDFLVLKEITSNK